MRAGAVVAVIRRVATAAWLVAVWVALWGGLTWANLASGLLVSVALLVLFPTGDGTGARIAPWPAVRYAVWFAGQLGLATWQVVVAALVPQGRVAPGVVAVRLRSRSALIATVVGNSVTLTPGTLTVDVLPADGEAESGFEAGVGAGVGAEIDPSPTDDVATAARRRDDDADADRARVLLVHALDLSDPDVVRASVLAFEARAVAAFGTPADRAALAEVAS